MDWRWANDRLSDIMNLHFIPVWVRKCRWSSSLRVNRFPQNNQLQTNGRSPTIKTKKRKSNTSLLNHPIDLYANADELWDAMFYCILFHNQVYDNCEYFVYVNSLQQRNLNDQLHDSWDNHIELDWLWVVCHFVLNYWQEDFLVNCSNCYLL